jgi:hypothetical protein
LDSWNGYLLAAELSAEATSFTDTGLLSETSYSYLVLALNDGDPNYGSRGYSDWSNEASATTDPAPGSSAGITAASPRPNGGAAREAAARALAKSLRSRLPERHPAAAAARQPPPPK